MKPHREPREIETLPAYALLILVGLLCLGVAMVAATLFNYYFYDTNMAPTAPGLAIERGKSLFNTDIKKIVCVYEARSVFNMTAKAKTLLRRYCTHVVACCMTKPSIRNNAVWTAARYLKKALPSNRIFIGISTSASKSRWLRDVLVKGENIASIINSISDALDVQEIGGGIMFYAPDYDPRTSKRAFTYFVRKFAKAMREARRAFLVGLPEDIRLERRLLSLGTINSGAVFIKTSHSRPGYNLTRSSPSCSTPIRSLGLFRTIETAVDEIEAGANPDRRNRMQEMTLFSLDTTCYQYINYPHPPFGYYARRTKPYSAYCVAGQNGTRSWRRFEEPISKCRIAKNDRTVFAVSNPKVVLELKSKLSDQFLGVVVFNFQLDDLEGLCGARFPFVKEVYCALEGIASDICGALR